MNKKYEFVEGDEVTTPSGVTLKRIRALVTIADTAFMPAVNPGDLGGYIQSENNLSEICNAWVYGDARVSGDTRVSDDAQVSGDAQVYGDVLVSGNAWVYGNARVAGNARVYGNARVCGNAWVRGDSSLFWASKVGSENGTLTVFNSQDGTLTVTRGCFIGSVDDFLDKSKRVHDEKTHREYCLLIEVAKSRIVCLDGETK